MTFVAAALSHPKHEEHSTFTKIQVGKVVRYFGFTITSDKTGRNAIDAAGLAICRPDAKRVTIIRQVITPTKSILNQAARRGSTEAPRFEQVREGRKRTDWVSPAKAEAMVAAASKKFRPARPRAPRLGRRRRKSSTSRC